MKLIEKIKDLIPEKEPEIKKETDIHTSDGHLAVTHTLRNDTSTFKRTYVLTGQENVGSIEETTKHTHSPFNSGRELTEQDFRSHFEYPPSPERIAAYHTQFEVAPHEKLGYFIRDIKKIGTRREPFECSCCQKELEIEDKPFLDIEIMDNGTAFKYDIQCKKCRKSNLEAKAL